MSSRAVEIRRDMATMWEPPRNRKGGPLERGPPTLAKDADAGAQKSSFRVNRP